MPLLQIMACQLRSDKNYTEGFSKASGVPAVLRWDRIKDGLIKPLYTLTKRSKKEVNARAKEIFSI